jgi:Zn-finger nucleic acid-binding protein
MRCRSTSAKCRGVWLDRGGRYKKRKKFSDIFDIFD